MTLPAGTKLGPYEILAALGAGGMGEVYRARDTRLGRDVAIKILPSQRAPTPEARERFEREAKTISQLAHPHVCVLHDVGREGDVEYLVMELLEGESLADRLGRGLLPLSQALRFGAEIASALDAAHRRGIVHRDLKPGNVMLTKSGVKLLDFGLARGFAGGAAAGGLTEAPTIVNPLTAEGVIVGTVAYMAPEQLEGRDADSRTDIFALGAVLYEMLTGRKAFTGTSNATLISAIMTSDPPPVSALQPVTPPELDRLVRTCLAKDPAERWQSAHDVELQLRAIGGSGATPAPAVVSPPSRRRAVAPWVVAAIAAVVAAFALMRGKRASPVVPEPIRFAVLPPEGGAFVYNVEGTFLAVSPDGRTLAFVASGGSSAPSGLSPMRGTLGRISEVPRVWLRTLDQIGARPLPGSEGAESVLWSPDGRALAFFTSDKLKRVDLPGGSPVSICDVPPGGGIKAGTWGRRAILFTSVQGGALYSVPPSGGSPAAFASVDPARPELRFSWPQFLSDGERYLYLVRDREGWGNLMLSEPGKSPRSVTRIASSFQLEPGYLLHVREGTLLAQPFDEKSGRVAGDPVAVADGVRYFYSTAGAGFAARGGTIAYEGGRDLDRLAWFDRSGREAGGLGSVDDYGFVHFAPDGRRLFFNRVRAGLGTLHIWSYDLDRGLETAVTNGRDTEAFPVPLADGKTLIYGGVRGAPPVLIRRDLPSGEEHVLTPQARAFQMPQDVSPDGRTLVYTERGELGNFDIWSVALDGSSPPAPLLRSLASKGNVRFSPDGRYLAFLSSESGRLEAYVMPFPGPGEKARISEGGASQVRWARTGELLYASGDRSLVAVPIKTSPRLEIGAPVKLFKIPGRPWNDFDVTPDGQRFLAVVPERVADEEPLDVIVNWVPAAAR